MKDWILKLAQQKTSKEQAESINIDALIQSAEDIGLEVRDRDSFMGREIRITEPDASGLMIVNLDIVLTDEGKVTWDLGYPSMGLSESSTKNLEQIKSDIKTIHKMVQLIETYLI